MRKARFVLVSGLAALLACPVAAREYWPAPLNRNEWVQNTERLMTRLRLPSAKVLQVAPGTYTGVVRFSVRPDGTVKDARMLESSGVAALDRTIVQQVTKMPFAPFPPDMGREERRFDQPVSLVLTAPNESAEPSLAR